MLRDAQVLQAALNAGGQLFFGLLALSAVTRWCVCCRGGGEWQDAVEQLAK